MAPKVPNPSNRRWLASGLIGLLAVGAMLPLAAAQEEQLPAPAAEHTEKDKSWKCKWLRLCKSPQHYPPGEFNETSGFVSGRYVEFTYDNATGMIVDFHVKFHRGDDTAPVKFFDAIALTPFDGDNATLQARGSMVHVKGDNATYVAHDVRRSMVGAAARGGNYTLVFDVADDCEASEMRRGVLVECDGIRGLINARTRGNVTVDNDTVTVEIVDRGAGAFALDPPKSARVKAWMREHAEQLRDRAEDEAREHADEARERAKDRAREEFRERMPDRAGERGRGGDRPGGGDRAPSNETDE